jgi:Protein of unknown function (DUF3305)
LSHPTPLMRIEVGLVVECRKAKSPWIEHVWRPASVLAGQPDTAPWTELTVTDEATIYYAGHADIALFRSDTTYYRANLESGVPLLWVALRPTGRPTDRPGIEPPYDILLVTANPAEGEALTEPGTDLVETVPMPEPVREAVAAFVAEHHVEQVFFKRKRDSAVPSARRAPIREDEG